MHLKDSLPDKRLQHPAMVKHVIFTTGLDIKIWVRFSVCDHCRSSINCHGDNFPPLHMVTISSGLLLKFTPGKVRPIFHLSGTAGCTEPLHPWICLESRQQPDFGGVGSSIWRPCRRGPFFCPMRHLYIISNPPKQESRVQGLNFSYILMLLSRDLLCSSVLAYWQSIFSYRACLSALVVLQRSEESLSFWDSYRWGNLTPPHQDPRGVWRYVWDRTWGVGFGMGRLQHYICGKRAFVETSHISYRLTTVCSSRRGKEAKHRHGHLADETQVQKIGGSFHPVSHKMGLSHK